MSDKKKIGLLTLPFHINYGGILQAFALKSFFERLGCEVYMLHQQDHSLSRTVKNFVRKIQGKKKPFERESKLMASFVKEHFDKWIDVSKDKNRMVSKMDALVVGSDQVWRFWNSQNLLFYFFDFAKDINMKKYAYSVSFGKDVWEVDECLKDKCKELVSLFSAVSVREDDGIGLCKTHFGIDVEKTIDPTFLLEKDEYSKLICSSDNPQSEIISYILDEDPDKSMMVSCCENFLGKRAKKINQTICIDGECGVFPSVESWILNYLNAQFVVTDSFHGTAFAINFEIPFIVLGNVKRGMSRIISILKMFDLENRLVCSPEMIRTVMNEKINWVYVRNKKNEYKQKSVEFLLKV